MENRGKKFGLLPYVVAILCFAALSALYFAPQYAGRAIRMHDITQYEGANRDLAEHNARYGEDPQWTGNTFSGMPATLISMRYDSLILKNTLMPVLNFLGQPASLIFLAMAAFFVMLLLCGVNPWVGIVPSLAYGLSTYFFIIIGAGHITKMVALAYAPLMLGAVFYTYRRNMWLGAALTALFASLELAANHPQITYYFVLVLLAFWINELVRAIREKLLSRFAKATGLLALAAVLAVGSNFAPLWYVNQYSKESIRGGSELTEQGPGQHMSGKRGSGLDLDYATAWSYGKIESFNMLIPNLLGGSSEGGFAEDGPVAQSLSRYNARNLTTQLPAYFGDQPMTAGPTYIGAVIIFLCVLGLFLLRGRCKWWVVVVTVVALLLSWGRNFMGFTELFFHYFPGYNKFRTVSMILVIAEWSVPFLAAFILDKLWRSEITKEDLMRALKRSVAIVGGVALLFLLLGGTLFDFSAPTDAQLPADVTEAMHEERLSMLRGDAFRSLLFVLLSAAVVWLYGMQRIRRGAMIALLAVLVCLDLVPVNLRFLPQSKFVEKTQTSIQPTAADRQILADTTLGYRVLNLTVSPFNDATTSCFHRSVGGYHGAKLQRYQDLIDRHLSQMHMGVYNMLNTKYIITADQTTGTPQVQLNPDANGAAWFVEAVQWAANADEEIAALDTLDNKRVAVVDRRFAEALEGVDLQADSTARIELVDYRANRLTYRYEAAREGVAVFSEIYYDKGWTATVDGVAAPCFRADYVLRAMVLPAGEHTVVFTFRATDFDRISNITLIFSLLIIVSVIAAAAAAVWCGRKKKREENHAGQQKA